MPRCRKPPRAFEPNPLSQSVGGCKLDNSQRYDYLMHTQRWVNCTLCGLATPLSVIKSFAYVL